jgi:glycerophosphoryl diester phosphodiesterase
VARRVLAARLPGMRPLALLILVLAISACSGGDDDSGPETSSSASSSVSASTDASVATTVPVSTVPPTTISPTTSPPTTAPTTVPPTTVPPSTVPPTTVPPTTAPPAGRPIIDDLVDADEVLNIAHAGGDQAWPHSTFYAFDRAVEAGADMLEMDVQLTGDGVLIVQHDDTVDGTTNGTGDVASFTFADITQLDAAYWYVPGCWPCRDRPEEEYVLRGVRTGERPAPDGVDPNTLRIVSFAELVERYPDVPLDIEIKGEGVAAEATARRLAAEIEQYGLTDHVVVVSFDDPTIELFRSLAPDVAVSPGVGAMSAWLLGGEALDPAFRIVQVPPMFGDVEVLTPEFWTAADAADVEVWVWPSDAATQENTEFYASVIEQGADGIIAGRPDLMP